MGVTGCGKSTFISRLSPGFVNMGYGFESCTTVAKSRQISGGLLVRHTDEIALRQESKDYEIIDELPETVISNDQTSHQNLLPRPWTYPSAPVNYNVHYTIPTIGSNYSSPFPFPAKEKIQFGTTVSDYEHLLQYGMNENDTNPNPGDLETVWSSLASHPSLQQQIRVFRCIRYTRIFFVDNNGFLKGWDEEWEHLQDPSFHHARIGQLYDRDYFWAVTQTMVSFENLASWAVHNVLTYKVYPGFWGRKGN
jgi:hypothetical protein